MQRLKISVTFFLLVTCTIAFCQDDDYSRRSRQDPMSDFERRVSFGGNIGMQFGTQTYIEFSPKVGYRLTDKLLAGGGITYIYYRIDRDKLYGYGGIYESSIYGGSIFTNYEVLDNLFPHIEYELLNFEYYDNFTNSISRKWINSLFVGAGFRQRIGQNSFIQLMLLYNLNYQSPSPYPSPFVTRLGIFI